MAKRAKNGTGTYYREGDYYCWRLSGSKKAGIKSIVRKDMTRQGLAQKVEAALGSIKKSGTRVRTESIAYAINLYVASNIGKIDNKSKKLITQHGITKNYAAQILSRATYLCNLFGDEGLIRVDHTHIQRIVADCGNTPEQCRKRVALFIRCLPPGLRGDVKDKAKDNRVRMPALAPQHERILSFKEADTMTAYLSGDECKYRDRWLYLTLSQTGLRIGEALAVTIFDLIDFNTDGATPMLRINKQGGFEPQGWNEDTQQFETEWEVGDTKNRKTREIPLNDIAVHAIKQQLKMRQQEIEAIGGKNYQDQGLLFPTSIGTPQSEGNLRRSLLKVIKACDIHDFSLHNFRHTYATHLAYALGDGKVKVVASLLGDSIEVSQKYYAHVHKLFPVEEITKIQIGSLTKTDQPKMREAK